MNAARAEGEEAVRRAMIINEQEQTLRRAGIDMTAAQSEEESEYASRIKALVSEIHVLQETEKRYQEAQRESQKTEREREKVVEDEYLHRRPVRWWLNSRSNRAHRRRDRP